MEKKLKYIKLFEDYNRLLEDENIGMEGGATQQPSTNIDNTPTDSESVKNLPRLKSVIDKEFFGELKEHIFYWFSYDFLKDKYVISTLENTENEVTVWFSDKGDKPFYEYKVIYTSIDNAEPLAENVQAVKMIISIYEQETSDLLKQTEMEVGLKYLNSKSFNNFINKVMKRIIKTPKDGEDIKDFKKKEERRLGDNIY